MKALPSIDLEEGRAVKRVRGERGTGLVLGDPLDIALRAWELGFERLHVVDLDGAERGSPSPRNLEAVKRIARETGIKVQLGGGIRSLDSALKACSTPGVDTLVVGTAWLRNPSFLDEIPPATGCRSVAALETRGGRLAVEGWRKTLGKTPGEALEVLSKTGAWGVLITLVDVEGTLRGVGGLVEELVSQARRALGERTLEYSGGVAGMEDLRLLEELGVDYVVLGMALHSGRVSWEEVARRYA